MTKRDKDLVKTLGSMGFEFDRTNSKNATFYVHPDTGCELKVIPGADERRARAVECEARRMIGLPTKDNKRNPEQIRERNAAEHARAARELEAARIARDESRPGLDEQQLRRVEDEFLRADRQFRYWDRLMREVSA